MAVSAPQTEHLAGFFSRSGEMERLACSRISAGTIGSAFVGVFRRMNYRRFHYRRNRRLLQPYAACGTCTITATSSDERHRGQRWPGATRTYLPLTWMSAGTVWVQIGQWTCPLVWFSRIAFMTFSPHFIRRTFGSNGCAKFVKNLKFTFDTTAGCPAARCYADSYEPAARPQDPVDQHSRIS